MGSSFVRFRGLGFWSNDGQIEVWLYLLTQVIDQLPNPPAWLQELRDYWLHQAISGGVGSISMGLDNHLTNDEKVSSILSLSMKALDWFDEQGPILSKETLNAMGVGGPGSEFTVDVNTEVFAQVGKTFVALLRGECGDGIESIT